MTKRKATQSKKQSNNTTLMAVIALLAVVVGGALVAMNASSGAPAAGSTVISPDYYIENYTNTDADHILIDVRTPGEFNGGHIAGAVNIPVEELDQRLSEVPADKDIVVYCRSGNRSATASRILTSSGFEGVYDMGGIIAWQQAGLPIE
jgi:rhodanese-related sulfurtransferase